jgi:hypothetical protein
VRRKFYCAEYADNSPATGWRAGAEDIVYFTAYRLNFRLKVLHSP